MKHLDITVDISSVKSTGTLGFGMPLILVSKATKAVEYTKCASVKEVATAIGDTAMTTDTCKIAQLIFGQENAPREIAICHSTSEAVSAIAEIEAKDWRQLIAVLGDGESIEAVSTAVEALDGKMYFVTVSDVAELADIKDNKRTVAFYHTTPNAVAALVGESAGRTVGSFTYKNLILKGIDPLEMTTDELSQIHTANAITFLQKCGDNVTSEGKTMSGEYIDIVDSIDYIKSKIEYGVQKLKNNSPKIAYTNAGISAIESEVVSVLEDAYGKGIINEVEGAPDYTTSFKTREEMTAEDRANRIYTGGNFRFGLAGAIHETEVFGELVI